MLSIKHRLNIEILNSGVELSGTELESSVLRGNTSYFIRVNGNSIAISNLSVESTASSFSSGAIDVSGDNFIADNILMRPVEGEGGYTNGIYIRGDNSVIRQSEFVNNSSGTAIYLSNLFNTTINNNSNINNNKLIVADYANKRIQVFDKNFQYYNSIKIPGLRGFTKFDVNSSNQIFVPLGGSGKIIKYDIRDGSIKEEYTKKLDKIIKTNGVFEENLYNVKIDSLNNLYKIQFFLIFIV